VREPHRLTGLPVTAARFNQRNYGPGLAERVRALAYGRVTAATDLFGTETAETPLVLGIPPVGAGARKEHPEDDPGFAGGGADGGWM
jgi:hypothetical protein